MPIMYTIVIGLLVFSLFEMIVIMLCEQDIEQLKRENQMYQRLLSDHANLHEISLNAYIAMLREAQRHMDGQ